MDLHYSIVGFNSSFPVTIDSLCCNNCSFFNSKTVTVTQLLYLKDAEINSSLIVSNTSKEVVLEGNLFLGYDLLLDSDVNTLDLFVSSLDTSSSPNVTFNDLLNGTGLLNITKEVSFTMNNAIHTTSILLWTFLPLYIHPWNSLTGSGDFHTPTIIHSIITPQDSLIFHEPLQLTSDSTLLISILDESSSTQLFQHLIFDPHYPWNGQEYTIISANSTVIGQFESFTSTCVSIFGIEYKDTSVIGRFDPEVPYIEGTAYITTFGDDNPCCGPLLRPCASFQGAFMRLGNEGTVYITSGTYARGLGSVSNVLWEIVGLGDIEILQLDVEYLMEFEFSTVLLTGFSVNITSSGFINLIHSSLEFTNLSAVTYQSISSSLIRLKQSELRINDSFISGSSTHTVFELLEKSDVMMSSSTIESFYSNVMLTQDAKSTLLLTSVTFHVFSEYLLKSKNSSAILNNVSITSSCVNETVFAMCNVVVEFMDLNTFNINCNRLFDVDESTVSISNISIAKSVFDDAIIAAHRSSLILFHSNINFNTSVVVSGFATVTDTELSLLNSFISGLHSEFFIWSSLSDCKVYDLILVNSSFDTAFSIESSELSVSYLFTEDITTVKFFDVHDSVVILSNSGIRYTNSAYLLTVTSTNMEILNLNCSESDIYFFTYAENSIVSVNGVHLNSSKFKFSMSVSQTNLTITNASFEDCLFTTPSIRLSNSVCTSNNWYFLNIVTESELISLTSSVLTMTSISVVNISGNLINSVNSEIQLSLLHVNSVDTQTLLSIIDSLFSVNQSVFQSINGQLLTMEDRAVVHINDVNFSELFSTVTAFSCIDSIVTANTSSVTRSEFNILFHFNECQVFVDFLSLNNCRADSVVELLSLSELELTNFVFFNIVTNNFFVIVQSSLRVTLSEMTTPVGLSELFISADDSHIVVEYCQFYNLFNEKLEPPMELRSSKISIQNSRFANITGPLMILLDTVSDWNNVQMSNVNTSFVLSLFGSKLNIYESLVFNTNGSFIVASFSEIKVNSSRFVNLCSDNTIFSVIQSNVFFYDVSWTNLTSVSLFEVNQSELDLRDCLLFSVETSASVFSTYDSAITFDLIDAHDLDTSSFIDSKSSTVSCLNVDVSNSRLDYVFNLEDSVFYFNSNFSTNFNYLMGSGLLSGDQSNIQIGNISIDITHSLTMSLIKCKSCHFNLEMFSLQFPSTSIETLEHPILEFDHTQFSVWALKLFNTNIPLISATNSSGFLLDSFINGSGVDEIIWISESIFKIYDSEILGMLGSSVSINQNSDLVIANTTFHQSFGSNTILFDTSDSRIVLHSIELFDLTAFELIRAENSDVYVFEVFFQIMSSFSQCLKSSIHQCQH
ncbi:hypothetical protein GEMRC1_006690 [Eukaryota sp. GEM-RC1]